MAAVSAWAKPGAWALDSEEQEATMAMEEPQHHLDSSSAAAAGVDFPSLAATATKKTSKKKKQTFSLAEFSAGAAEKKLQPSRSSDETLVLPTGPRERSAEELERRRGFGYSSYGARGGGRESRVSDEPRREPRNLEPSRADEVDNWGANKRSVGPERRERERGGGFFDSQSRADESDSWISKKPVAPASGGRVVRGGFDTFGREGSGGGRVDSDTWGRKREEAGAGSMGGGRPRLVLQPRSLLVVNGSEAAAAGKSKGSNPFGEARPREEVLKEKGKDWKEIDEKLEAVRIQGPPPAERKELGMGNGGLRDDRTERTWKKPEALATPPQERTENVEQSSEN